MISNQPAKCKMKILLNALVSAARLRGRKFFTFLNLALRQYEKLLYAEENFLSTTRVQVFYRVFSLHTVSKNIKRLY